MENSLRIKGLNEELELGISLLSSITDMKEVKNKEKFNSFIAIVTAIVASNDLITIIITALQHNLISIYIIVAKKLIWYMKQL